MKLLYQVNEQRLLKELELQAKNKGKGVLNWYKSLENGVVVVNVFFDVFGVTYYYKELDEKLSVIMKMNLDARSKILFPVDAKDLMPKFDVGVQTL